MLLYHRSYTIEVELEVELELDFEVEVEFEVESKVEFDVVTGHYKFQNSNCTESFAQYQQ